MPQLYPHLLLRTDAAASAAATVLRCAGYVVTKIGSDDAAERLAAAAHIDAIVVDLPLMQAIALARRSTHIDVPMLFMTGAPESLGKIGGDVATLHTRDADDLVCAVDLLIASHEKSQVTAATVEAVRK
jgi:response regulator RpfG family c-di-GMP phosphodiesterase